MDLAGSLPQRIAIQEKEKLDAYRHAKGEHNIEGENSRLGIPHAAETSMSDARWRAFVSSSFSRAMMLRADSIKTTMFTEPML